MKPPRLRLSRFPYTITGAGNVKLEYLLSPIKDGTFLEPGAVSDITGAAGVGLEYVAFAPILVPFIKIKATEYNAGSIMSLN